MFARSAIYLESQIPQAARIFNSQNSGEFIKTNIFVMTAGSFRRRRKERAVKFVTLNQSGRKFVSADASRCRIILPAASFEITSDDAFDREDFGTS